jgi:hypothetical protein
MAIDFVCLIGTALFNDVIPCNIFSKAHPLFGFIFFACVFFHVFLNWNWVKANILPVKKKSAPGS